MKIRQMIFSILLVCSVVPMLLISVWGIQAYDAKLEHLLEENLRSVATAQVQSLDWFFSQMDHSLMVTSNFKTVRAMLEASNRDDRAEVQRLRPFIDDVLATQMNEYTYIDSVTLLDRSFRIIASSFPVATWQVSKLKNVSYGYEKGRTLFTDIIPAQSSSQGRDVIAGIRPVYYGDALCGYIIDELNLSYFKQLREGMEVIETGTLYLIDARGGLVTAGNKAMTREAYLQQDIDTVDFSRKWEEQRAGEKASGFLRYLSHGQEYMTYYARLQNTGWRVFVSANFDLLVKKENTVRDLAIFYCFLFSVLLFWGNYLISYRIARPVEDLIRQVRWIKYNKDFRMRIRRMPNNEIGMLAGAFNALLEYIEQNTRELWQSREKYNVVLSHTDNIFIERDYCRGTWSASQKFEEIFGYPFPYENLKQMGCMTEYIHPEDRKAYERWAIRSFRANEKLQVEVRLRDWRGEFIWVRVTLLPVVDKNGQVTASVGLMTNIDRERQELARLQERAQLDPLTRALNKDALREAVLRIIERQQPCAVLFVDIDDFREFNTNYGHIQGDEVLKFVAEALRRHFDIVGRNGGDEFVACALALERLEAELWALTEELAAGVRLEGATARVCCSIGAVLYPRAAATYEGLLRRADEAMYAVKERGKNSFYIVQE